MIVSMSVLPSRVKYIKPVIDSLLAQTVKPEIHVWIPTQLKRKPEVKFNGNIPGFLKKCNVKIVDDIGPISKLMYALDISDEFVTVDDDCIYGPGFIEGFDKHRNNAALCYRGRRFTNGRYETTKLYKGIDFFKEVDIVTGTWGCYYKSEWFKDFRANDRYFLVDDIQISAHLNNKNIPMFVIPLKTYIKPVRELYTIDDLFTNNKNHENNNHAIKHLYQFRGPLSGRNSSRT